MNRSVTAGKRIFLAAIAAFGVSCLVRANVIPGLEPASPPDASRAIAGWVTGIALLAAVVAAVPRATARYGALAIAVIFFLWVALLHAPILIAHPRSGNQWTGAFEAFAIGSAALVLFGLAPDTRAGRTDGVLAARMVKIGRLFYALSLPVFGLLHFLYIGYVASVIPAWIPAHVAFGYATGSAHIAGGVSIATGLLARVAAYCVAAMFGSWVIILHTPRVLAHLHEANEWTSLMVALAMCGGALTIAGTLAKPEALAAER
jgi:uncharacterized membrane protein